MKSTLQELRQHRNRTKALLLGYRGRLASVNPILHARSLRSIGSSLTNLGVHNRWSRSKKSAEFVRTWNLASRQEVGDFQQFQRVQRRSEDSFWCPWCWEINRKARILFSAIDPQCGRLAIDQNYLLTSEGLRSDAELPDTSQTFPVKATRLLIGILWLPFLFVQWLLQTIEVSSKLQLDITKTLLARPHHTMTNSWSVLWSESWQAKLKFSSNSEDHVECFAGRLQGSVARVRGKVPWQMMYLEPCPFRDLINWLSSNLVEDNSIRRRSNHCLHAAKGNQLVAVP